MPASVSDRRSGDVLIVVVSGDIDISTSGSVESAVAGAVATDGVKTVEIDLSGVRFLDSSGISLLLKGRRSADRQGVGFKVTGAHGVAKRVLEITGVWDHLSDEHNPA